MTCISFLKFFNFHETCVEEVKRVTPSTVPTLLGNKRNFGIQYLIIFQWFIYTVYTFPIIPLSNVPINGLHGRETKTTTVISLHFLDKIIFLSKFCEVNANFNRKYVGV